MSRREILDLGPSEFRFAPDDAGGVLSGYGAVWDVLVPSFNERVLRGAFTRTLAEHRNAGTRPVMLYAHAFEAVVGVWSTVVEDERGLKVEGRVIPETARGPECRALLKAGAISGLSLGFTDRAKRFDAKGVRLITDVDLPEISIVAFPASPTARITSYRSAANPASLAAFAQAASRAATSIRGKA